MNSHTIAKAGSMIFITPIKKNINNTFTNVSFINVSYHNAIQKSIQNI